METSIDGFSYINAGVVFFAYFLADVLYARYTLDVAGHKEYSAAHTGMLIHVLFAVGIATYTKNMLYILPMALGSWIGTYLMVRYERGNRDRAANSRAARLLP